MKICIPSYNRYETIQEKSIKVLLNAGYKPQEIDIFVADEEQLIKYREKMDKDISIIVAIKGLKEVREFIFNYYDEGEKLLCLDDDIEVVRELYKNEDGKSRLRPIQNLKEIVDYAFHLCEQHSLKLWGLYPTPSNAFFMENQKEITYDYKFIIGNFFGCINCRNMNKLLVPDMDDYERSIRSYLIYGGSIRFNHLAPKTKFKKNTGGAQAVELGDRENRLQNSKEIMLNTYPELLYLRKRKTDTNPILKDLRKSVKKN
tara:strand:- start:325 stop:1101 length:777 start_codon:yes stop_codon:yes gene_type:complete